MSSLPAIRVALETALAAITPSLATAYENVPSVPTVGVPYQQAFLLAAQPANIEIGPGYIDQGIFQVNIFWPKDVGSGPAMTQAELIRSTFKFGATFALTSGGSILITNTTEIGQGVPDGDRYMVPVKVRWQARIGS